MVKYTFYFFSLIISFSVFALDQVTASIDKNPAIQGESLVLDVIANDSVDVSALDTSILLKDFIVGRTSSSTQTRIINGQRTRQTKWTTLLIPKTSGQVTIPAFNIQGVNSVPISLEVLDKSNSQLQKNRDIYISTEVSKKDIYVQEQFTLTIKLHIALALESGSLSEPLMRDANIAQIGKDIQKEELINGRRYQVIERQYAITPLSSGEYSLEMPIFSGQVSSQTQRRSGMFGFQQTKPVSVIADAINVIIKPQPAGFQGTWLPSELFTIHDEWQPNLSEFKVGEPITRTITITAVGLTKEQLPSIDMSALAGLKVYPDKPQLHSGTNQQRLVSQAVINFAIVASHTGTFDLPEIRIPWWNTVTNREEVALLPTQRITVQENPDNSFNTPNINLPLNGQQKAPQKSIDSNNGLVAQDAQTIIIEKNSWLQWLFLTLWLITSVLLILSIKSNKQTKIKTNKRKNNDIPYQRLIAACEQNDAQTILSSITPWVKEIYKEANINSINEALNTINDTELTTAVETLQTSLYGKTPQEWHSEKLALVIKRINKKRSSLNLDSDILLNP